MDRNSKNGTGEVWWCDGEDLRPGIAQELRELAWWMVFAFVIAAAFFYGVVLLYANNGLNEG